MNKRVLLLGLGMQGQAALYDLASLPEFSHIVAADSRPDLATLVERYAPEKVTAVPLDAFDENRLAALVRDADIVVEALPSTFALRTGQLAARCGVPLVSSMFYSTPEGIDEGAVAELGRVAKERGITILTEFGMDPGLDLLMAAKAVAQFDEVHVFHTYGAGLPAGEARDNPLQYKFSWSPAGVMRSYHRSSIVIRDGATFETPAEEIFEAHNCHAIDVP